MRGYTAAVRVSIAKCNRFAFGARLKGMSILFAVISGTSVIQVVLWLIVVGLIFWLLDWLIRYVGLPEPFAKIARVVLGVAAVILIINALLSLVGSPFISW